MRFRMNRKTVLSSLIMLCFIITEADATKEDLQVTPFCDKH